VFYEVCVASAASGAGRRPAAIGLDSPQAAAAASWLRQLVETGVTPASVADFAEPEALQA